MDQRQYELTFILPPSLAEDEIATVQETIEGWITSQDGEIIKASHWGRRKLAYLIQNFKEGYYILLEIKADPSIFKDVDRRLRLEAHVLRHLVVRIDE